jgi:hypothetical protein
LILDDDCHAQKGGMSSQIQNLKSKMHQEVDVEFESKAQRAAYEQVSNWINDMAAASPPETGVDFFVDPEAPRFVVTYGSSTINVLVQPLVWEADIEQNDALIVIRADVVYGARMTAESMHYLLRQNERMVFGTFGLGSQNEIFFGHTLPMSVCGGPDELALYLAMIIKLANQFDEEITMRWGGYRAADVAV